MRHGEFAFVGFVDVDFMVAVHASKCNDEKMLHGDAVFSVFWMDGRRAGLAELTLDTLCDGCDLRAPNYVLIPK